MRHAATVAGALALGALFALLALLAGLARGTGNGPRAPSPPAGRPAAPPVPVSGGSGGAEAGAVGRWLEAEREVPLAARLFTPRAAAEECTEACPPALRVVGGAEGLRAAAAVLEGVAAAARRLAAEPALDREVGSALDSTLRAVAASAAARTGRTLRALLVRGVTDVPASASRGVGVCLSDLEDPWFDRRRPRRGGGARVLVNRIEGDAREPGGAPRLLGGVVEFAGDGAGGGSGPQGDAALARLRNPIGLHFRDEALPTVAIFLDLDGSLYTHGYFGQGRRRLRESPALRRALEDVLRAA
jgi:hypothetical protein